MADRKYKCKHCGEVIELTRTEKETIAEGWSEPPNICTECFEMIEYPPGDEETFDSDNGL